jgi:hypothetical protein
MAHSENKNPWFSKPYVQHYDDAGNEIGKSFHKTNPITSKTKTVHTDQNNNKIGSSENVKDTFTGKSHTQHFDQDGTPTSYTETKKNFFGKYRSYTKSGKKRTTQEYLAIIILIGLAIYFIVKVILPIAFVLTTPVITIIALVNIIKSKDETYFKYSLICSTLFILDYLFNGYSSYLMADESFVSENLYINLGVAFVCFGLSIVSLFYNQLNQILLKFNIENINGRKSIVVLLFLILLIPFYFVENKFLNQPAVDNSKLENVASEKPNIEQSTNDKSNLEQSNISNKENLVYNNSENEISKSTETKKEIDIAGFLGSWHYELENGWFFNFEVQRDKILYQEYRMGCGYEILLPRINKDMNWISLDFYQNECTQEIVNSQNCNYSVGYLKFLNGDLCFFVGDGDPCGYINNAGGLGVFKSGNVLKLKKY